MKVNITRAHELTGKSRTTIYKHIKSGKVSASGNKEDGFEIDIAELDRVYGVKKQPQNDTSSDVHAVQDGTNSDEHLLATKVALLSQQVEMLSHERRREREQMQEQIDRLQETLTNAQDHQTRLTALLTDRRQHKDAKDKEEQALLIRELRVGQARLRQELQDVRDQKGFLAHWLGVGGRKKQRQPRRAQPATPRGAGT